MQPQSLLTPGIPRLGTSPAPKPYISKPLPEAVWDLLEMVTQTQKDARITRSVSGQSIQRSAHTVQRYEALKNLYDLVGPDPFDLTTQSLTPAALKALSDFNAVDLALIPDPKFFSDLRLATMPPSPPSSTSEDDAQVAADLENISTMTGINPPWTVAAGTSPVPPEHFNPRPASHRSPDSSASEHDSDSGSDYAPDADEEYEEEDMDDPSESEELDHDITSANRYSADDDDQAAEEDDNEGAEEDDDDDEELAMVGIPAFNPNPETYFTSSGSLGSTSPSATDSD